LVSHYYDLQNYIFLFTPNVFVMSPCESSPGSLLVGCLATGFSPAESVNFKWMDQRGNSLTNFIQYPTVGTGNKRLKVSHITINEAEWNQSKIICEAGHPSGKVTETFTTVVLHIFLFLVLVTAPKSTSVMCVIEDFYPKKIDVQWKVNNTNSMSQLKLERKLNDTGHYTAYSFYEVSRENWDVNTQYTCEVTHRGEQFTTTAYFKGKSSNVDLNPSVTIYKPDSMDKDHVSHVCEVTSPKLSDVYIMWRVGKESYREGTNSAPIHQKHSTSVLSILTMTKEEYNKLSTTISCAVKHASMDNISAPLQASTSQSKQPELSCD
uniref:Immunoglobulin heavy constant zeta n=1 Tax=Sinocyclocheilus grahami TaxID=75366 RepID=A0A672K199_SINGR